MENLGFITVIDHPQHGLIGGYLVLNQAGRPLEFHCTNPVRPSKTQEILFGVSLEPYLYGEQIARALVSKSKLDVVVILTNIVSTLAVNGLINFPVAYIFDNIYKNNNDKNYDNENNNSNNNENINSNNNENINGDGDSNVTSEETGKETESKKFISEDLNKSLQFFGIEDKRLETNELSNAGDVSTIPQVAGLDVNYWQGYVVGNRTVAIPGEQAEERKQLLDELKRIARNVDLLEPFTRIKLAIAETHNYN
ncbi:MAG: hypothetical protein LBP59_11980 [Planctomycetaceae bacterium]|jgi:hypothetical protein|nr:hypothetical protein [Planctomycetaceae bacterium]